MPDKLTLGLVLLILACVAGVGSFNHFLRDDHTKNIQEVAAHWTTMQIILLRTCRVTWPLMGDEYDKCIAKIKKMYRNDI